MHMPSSVYMSSSPPLRRQKASFQSSASLGGARLDDGVVDWAHDLAQEGLLSAKGRTAPSGVVNNV
eukprot:scaffold273145_cov27-Tisochrysis_lutea.AAC.2